MCFIDRKGHFSDSGKVRTRANKINLKRKADRLNRLSAFFILEVGASAEPQGTVKQADTETSTYAVYPMTDRNASAKFLSINYYFDKSYRYDSSTLLSKNRR